MLNMNRVTLLGHAGRDPEIRTIKSGDKTATFSLATTEKWRRKDGGTGEATEWHRIVVFGTAVEAAAKLVRKGAALLIEGASPRGNIRTRRAKAAGLRKSSSRDRKATSMCCRRAGTTAARKRAARRREPAILAGPSARTPTGEADGAAPDGPSGFARQL